MASKFSRSFLGAALTVAAVGGVAADECKLPISVVEKTPSGMSTYSIRSIGNAGMAGKKYEFKYEADYGKLIHQDPNWTTLGAKHVRKETVAFNYMSGGDLLDGKMTWEGAVVIPADGRILLYTRTAEGPAYAVLFDGLQEFTNPHRTEYLIKRAEQRAGCSLPKPFMR